MHVAYKCVLIPHHSVLQARAFSLYIFFFCTHIFSATFPARAARAARVSRRLLVRLHICRATLEARFARADRVWIRAHLFFSMVSATFPARRHNSSAILLLCVHFTHLLCSPTSAAWHLRSALRSHTLLLPCALVHRTFLIFRNLERIARLYERSSLAFAARAALAAASSAFNLDTSALRREILRSALLRPRAIARACAPSFFPFNFSKTSFFFHLFAFAFR